METTDSVDAFAQFLQLFFESILGFFLAFGRQLLAAFLF